MCCILDSLLSDLFTLFRQIVLDSKFITSLARALQKPLSDIGRGCDAGEGGGRGLGGRSLSQLESNLNNYNSNNSTPPHQVKKHQATSNNKYSYKMMSKKGLLKFVKYTLIFSNAFGFILSIFLGLFGLAYPDKHFPLSYKGKEMALCSLFCMLFTAIGYCGAQNHRRILLIIYGATNVIIVIIVVILWFLFRENSILGNKEISNMFITTLAITIAVMFLFAFILAFHIKTFKDDTQDSIVSQSHQLLQQTTAFLQQQQQHHQQQASLLAAATGAATRHHHPATAHLGGGPNSVPMNIDHHHEHPYMASHHGAHQLASVSPGHHHQIGGGSLHHQQQAGLQHMGTPGIMAPPHARHSHLSDLSMMNGGGPQQQQQHHHHQSGGGGGGFQLMMPPPPPPVQLHAHLKSSSSSSGNPRIKKPLQSSAALMLAQAPTSNQGGAGSHQMTLMRNQSSPLPGGVQMGPAQPSVPQQGSGSVRASQGKSSSSTGQQQLYSQSQKSIRGNQQQQQPPSPPPPPPPPMPPGKQSGSGGGQQQSANTPHHHHHHSTRSGDRTMMGPNAATNNRLPSCPVQYCTFDCDRTV